jgi:3-deoxy-D-manno-octulosonic-acid transferase
MRMIKSRRMWWACSTHGREEKCIESSGRKLEEKRLLGRPRHGLEDI